MIINAPGIAAPCRTFFHEFVRMTSCALASLALVCLLGTPAWAQVTRGMTPPGLAPGKATGSYAVSGIENVNLYSGNLNFNLPLLNVGGRGSVGGALNLTLDTGRWETMMVSMGASQSYPQIT